MKELTPIWKRTFSIQLCLQAEDGMSLGDSIAEAAVPETETTQADQNSDRLSTTQEENSEDITTDNEEDQQAFLSFAGEYFPGADLDAVRVVFDALALESNVDEACPEPDLQVDASAPRAHDAEPDVCYPDVSHQFIHYTQADINISNYGQPDLVDSHGNPYVEVFLDPGAAKCFIDDAAMASGETVALRIFSTYKQAVIQREANLLTNKELQQHADLAAAAILEELHIWNNHNCFRRRLRSQCRNVMGLTLCGQMENCN